MLAVGGRVDVTLPVVNGEVEGNVSDIDAEERRRKKEEKKRKKEEAKAAETPEEKAERRKQKKEKKESKKLKTPPAEVHLAPDFAIGAEVKSEVPVPEGIAEVPATVEVPADVSAAVEVAADVPAAVEVAADVPAAVEVAADIPVAVEVAADVPASIEVAADVQAAVEITADVPAVAVDIPAVAAEVPAAVEVAADIPAAVEVTGDTPAAVEVAVSDLAVAADIPEAIEVSADIPVAAEVPVDVPAAVDITAYIPAVAADVPAAVEVSADIPAAVEIAVDVPAAVEVAVEVQPVDVEVEAPVEAVVEVEAPAAVTEVETPAIDVELGTPSVAIDVPVADVTADVEVEVPATPIAAPPVSAPAAQESEKVETEESEEYIDGQLCKVRRTVSTKTIITEQIVPLTDVVCTKAPTEEADTVAIQVNVDHEEAEETTPPPNLLCFCKTPSGKQAYGLLTNNNDGTYTIDINASEPGMHVVDIINNGKKVPGSPFLINIIQAVDRKKVLLYGKGLQSGLLSEFDGGFHVDTTGAGPGDLKVRVQGPKETFNVTMSRDENDDRIVNVNYTPTVAGVYTVNVFWSGDHVEGSPVEVVLANDENELNRWLNGPSLDIKADVNLDGGLLVEAC